MTSVRNQIYQCLLEQDAAIKVELTEQIYAQIQDKIYDAFHKSFSDICLIKTPGYPQKLNLVNPAKVKQRKLSTKEGRAALIHAIAHIEYTAMNIAWDAVYRFPGMPVSYYLDWSRVAYEESKHFQLLNVHLKSLGYEYGDFPAHAGLWEVTYDTSGDVLHRMALVPRVFEARGLDVTPAITDKFRSVGDERMVEILNIIFEEELIHVEIGTRWFHYCCEKEGLEPESTFQQLVSTHLKGVIRRPINNKARRAAGFSEPELDWLNLVAS